MLERDPIRLNHAPAAIAAAAVSLPIGKKTGYDHRASFLHRHLGEPVGIGGRRNRVVAVVLAWVLALSSLLANGPAEPVATPWPFDAVDLCAAGHDGRSDPADPCQTSDCCTLCVVPVALPASATALPTVPRHAGAAPLPASSAAPRADRDRPQWPRAPPVGLITGMAGA